MAIRLSLQVTGEVEGLLRPAVLEEERRRAV